MSLFTLMLLFVVFSLVFILVRFTDQKGRVELPNPGIGWTWIITTLARILTSLLPLISVELRDELEGFLLDYYNKTLATTNPWDDFLARFLLRIFVIPVPPES